jgi:hypothetical protein
MEKTERDVGLAVRKSRPCAGGNGRDYRACMDILSANNCVEAPLSSTDRYFDSSWRESGLDARTFVSNLGFESIYILEIILTIWSADGERETSIADRTELAKEGLSSLSTATFQGPLKSGEFVDIGSFENLLQGAHWNTATDLDPSEISCIETKIAAISAASSIIVAAHRQFYIDFKEDK